MTQPHIQLSADLQLDPMLDAIVQELSRQRPDWTFSKPPARPIDNTPTYSTSIEGKVKAPEGVKFIQRVRIFQQSRFVGEIKLATRYRHYKANDHVYELYAERMDNGRNGTRMASKDMRKIISAAKKYCVPFNDGEILYEHAEDANHKFQRAVHKLSSEVRGMLRGDLPLHTQIVLRDLLLGNSPDPVMLTAVKDAVTSPHFEKALSRFLLSEEMSGAPRKVVSEIHGQYVMFVDKEPVDKKEAASAPLLSAAFEMLPDDMQNKIAVLQMVDEMEFVRGVGFRAGPQLFIVLT